MLELSSVTCDDDWSIDNIVCNKTAFVDTVLTYISGFIMRTIIRKEKCTFCYTFLTESKQRVTCTLINNKQLGGLIYPISDVVDIVNLANRHMKLFTYCMSFSFFILKFKKQIYFILNKNCLSGVII